MSGMSLTGIAPSTSVVAAEGSGTVAKTPPVLVSDRDGEGHCSPLAILPPNSEVVSVFPEASAALSPWSNLATRLKVDEGRNGRKKDLISSWYTCLTSGSKVENPLRHVGLFAAKICSVRTWAQSS